MISYFLELYDINQQYHLTNSKERNAWFTQVTREQDCFYRRYQCDPYDNSLKMQSPRDKYVDE